MKVIKPVTFATSMLASSTATETVALWAAGTTYAAGAKVRYGTRIYTSAIAGNVGKQPDISTTEWVNSAPANTYAMFDDQISTATTATNTLTVVVKPGLVDSMALVGVYGSTVTITVKDKTGGAVTRTVSQAMDGSVVTDWYQYFFEPFVQGDQVVVTGLQMYSTQEITITVTGGGAVGVGGVVFGVAYDLGDVEFGLSIGTDDYSRVTTDEFGVTSLTRRTSAKKSSMTLRVSKGQLRKVFQILDDLRATPSVWIPCSDDADYDFLSVYGIRSSFELVVDYPTYSLYSLELKGMI